MEMHLRDFRHQIEQEAEDAYAAMANESLSDSQEQYLVDLTFDEPDEEALHRLIEASESVTGHIYWAGGFRSPFEAKRVRHHVVARFGPWESMPNSV